MVCAVCCKSPEIARKKKSCAQTMQFAHKQKFQKMETLIIIHHCIQNEVAKNCVRIPKLYLDFSSLKRFTNDIENAQCCSIPPKSYFWYISGPYISRKWKFWQRLNGRLSSHKETMPVSLRWGWGGGLRNWDPGRIRVSAATLVVTCLSDIMWSVNYWKGF